jgi:sugar-specific transcriptional regulator TrmB
MPEDGSRSSVVDHLTLLGLSIYAARTFVALVALGDDT